MVACLMVFLLQGCIQVSSKTDYAGRKALLVFSIVDTVSQSGKVSHIDISHFLTGEYRNSSRGPRANEIALEFDKKQYDLIFSGRIGMEEITQGELEQIQKHQFPESRQSVSYDHAIVSVLKQYKEGVLLKKAFFQSYLLDIRGKAVVWDSGVISAGPDFEPILDGLITSAFISDYKKNGAYTEAIRRSLKECPLLK